MMGAALVLMALILGVTKVASILPLCGILSFSGLQGTTGNQCILQAPAGMPANAFVIIVGTQALISLFMSSYTLNSKFTMNSLQLI